MIDLRPAANLGVTNRDHLTDRHHFCYGSYELQERLGWGSLRVLNHTQLKAGAEVPVAPLDNVEMLQWVRRGVVCHDGTIGGGLRTVAGEVLVTSAGAGIMQGNINCGRGLAEYFDIRIASDAPGGEPTWQKVQLPSRVKPGRLVTLASGFDEDTGVLRLRARARVAVAKLPVDSSLTYRLSRGHHAYIVSVAGCIEINGHVLGAGDGAAIYGEPMIRIMARRSSEWVMIDSR
jgi:redox-sensitive bicupin YhaK (pirin superfamily)